MTVPPHSPAPPPMPPVPPMPPPPAVTERVSAYVGAVMGDGTTASGRARRRWRRVRWTLLVLAALALVVGVLAVTRPTTSDTPYAPDSTAPAGSRALAQVLGRQGVEVRHVTTVGEAVRAAGPGTMLLVTPSPLLTPEQAAAIADVPASLVLVEPGGTLLDLATDGAVGLVHTPAGGLRAPRCELPAAVAAGELGLFAGLEVRDGELLDAAGGLDGEGVGGEGLDGTGGLDAAGVQACWPAGRAGAVALAQVEVDPGTGPRTVTAVADPALLRNGDVATAGNAALALHLLGGTERLVWLVQDPFDLSTGAGVSADAGMLPAWAGPVGLWALLCALVAAAWRSRRLGPLVTEDLPVVVPAAEATRGRGRLYRRARARGHAAAALRAACADRLAGRLGVPRTANGPTLSAAVVRATGRDPQDVARLLYGPPPADDAALAALARRLDDLKSEVHRP